MDYLISSLLVAQPTGLWEKIIMAFEGGLGSFALSIILLTLIIKVITSPIDFFNRRTNKSMADKQKKIQPQIESIQKKYANNKDMMNQKLGELYKKEQVNPMGSCIVVLVNLAMTFTIFLTLFNGMNTMAAYKIADQYEQLQIAYVQEYAGDDLDLEQEGKSVYEICLPYITQMNEISDEDTKNNVISTANKNVEEVYQKTKSSFLWIDNIWMADSPYKNSIPTYSEYATVAKLTEDEKNNEEYKSTYEQIMNPLRETKGRTNGYFVLLVICAGVTFLNQWLMVRKNKKSGVQTGGKGMLIFMPLFMASFTLFYTTMFSLYMITGQIVSLMLLPAINALNNYIDNKKQSKNVPTDRLKRI